MKRPSLVALLLGAVALSGCTTIGGNIKGSFDCKAPSGSCAPMGVSDATAVGELGATAGSIDDAVTGRAGMILAGIGDGVPGRTNDRVLKVVFPAHTDGSGIYRDEATARVVVERGGWVSSPLSVAAAAPRGELLAERQTEAALAAMRTGSKIGDAMAVASGTPAASAINAVAAPSGLRDLAGALKAEPVPRLEVAAEDLLGDPDDLSGGDLPSPEALAAARAGHRIGSTPTSGTLKATAAAVPAPARPIAAPGKVTVHRGSAPAAANGVRVARGGVPAARSSDTSTASADPFAPAGIVPATGNPR